MRNSLSCAVVTSAASLSSRTTENKTTCESTHSVFIQPPTPLPLQLIHSLLKSMDDHTKEAKDREEASRLSVCFLAFLVPIYPDLLPQTRSRSPSGQALSQISVFVSFNVRLPSKRHFSGGLDDHRVVYAAISSVSLSLIATGVDACFDFGSNLFLYLIHKQADKMDINKWPVGGARLETIGNIIYGEILTGLFHVTRPYSYRKVLCSLVSQALPTPWPNVCTECPRSTSLSLSSPFGH
jgi:hypothetical protein